MSLNGVEECVHIAVNLGSQLVTQNMFSFIDYFTLVGYTCFYPWCSTMITLLVILCVYANTVYEWEQQRKSVQEKIDDKVNDMHK